MDKYVYDENNGLWYELHDDYYLPCLTLSEEETQPIRTWGRRHLRYLKEHRKAVRPSTKPLSHARQRLCHIKIRNE